MPGKYHKEREGDKGIKNIYKRVIIVMDCGRKKEGSKDKRI